MGFRKNQVEDYLYPGKKCSNLMQKYCNFADSIFKHKVVTFGHQKLLKNGDYYALSNVVDILEMYIDEHAYEDLEVFNEHRDKSSGCIVVYPDLYKGDLRYNAFLHKIKQKFKVDINLSIVEKNDNYWQVFGWSFQSSLSSIHEDQSAILQELAKNNNLVNAYLNQFKKELYLLEKKESLFHINWKDIDREFKTEWNVSAKDCQEKKKKLSFLLESGVLEKSDLYLQGVGLTKKERQCLDLYLQGMMIKEIGKVMVRSHRTIETHINNIRDKLRANSTRNDVFVKARKMKLLEEL